MIIHFLQSIHSAKYQFFYSVFFLQIILALNASVAWNFHQFRSPNQQQRPLSSLLSDSYSRGSKLPTFYWLQTVLQFRNVFIGIPLFILILIWIQNLLDFQWPVCGHTKNYNSYLYLSTFHIFSPTIFVAPGDVPTPSWRDFTIYILYSIYVQYYTALNRFLWLLASHNPLFLSPNRRFTVMSYRVSEPGYLAGSLAPP